MMTEIEVFTMGISLLAMSLFLILWMRAENKITILENEKAQKRRNETMTKTEEKKLTVNLKQISDSMKYRLIALKAILGDLELLQKELEETVTK